MRAGEGATGEAALRKVNGNENDDIFSSEPSPGPYKRDLAGRCIPH